jgi:hypothetical protein
MQIRLAVYFTADRNLIALKYRIPKMKRATTTDSDYKVNNI